jgi:hypothetical protein
MASDAASCIEGQFRKDLLKGCHGKQDQPTSVLLEVYNHALDLFSGRISNEFVDSIEEVSTTTGSLGYAPMLPLVTLHQFTAGPAEVEQSKPGSGFDGASYSSKGML